MVQADPQAMALNEVIQKHPVVYDLLSNRGKAIYFPKKGILGQTAEAKDTDLNATIGIALEDDYSPMRLKAIAKKIKLDPGEVFPYASSFGKKELREYWKQRITQQNPSLLGEISLPIVTSALTHGLSIAGFLFVNPQDTIILPDLFWGNYRLIYSNVYGAELKTYALFSGKQYDAQNLRAALAGEPGKKIVLLNFPHNPTGYTPTAQEMQQTVDVLKESADMGNKIIVIIDDAYFGLFFQEECAKESFFAHLASLHQNIVAVKIDGPTKEDFSWGLRVGFITFATKDGTPELYGALEDKAAGAVRSTISNTSNLSQSLLLEAYSARKYQKEKQKKYRILHERFEEAIEVVHNPNYHAYFEPLPCNSGYFLCIRLKEGLNPDEVRKVLIQKYSTGVIAQDNVLRVAFAAVPRKSLQDVFDNIYRACADLMPKEQS